MRPALAPINTVITVTKDLEHVYRRLLASSLRYTRVRAVNSGQGSIVTPSMAIASPHSSYIVDSGMPISSAWGYDVLGPLKPISTASDPFYSLKGPRPKPPSLISPDSTIRCDSPDCPIKGIPHNIGRYFDDGERPLPDEADDVARFFNCTSPPEDIVVSYIRICYDEASQADKDKVRQYQKHHMWSPINTQPSTPRLRDPENTLPERYAHLIDGETTDIVYAVIESIESSPAPQIPELSPIRIQTCLPSSEQPMKQSRSADSEDSDDETYVNNSENGGEIESQVNNPHYPMVGSYEDDDRDSLGRSEATREVPQGHELKGVQLRLQARILGQIGQLVHGPDSPPTDWNALVAAWGKDDD